MQNNPLWLERDADYRTKKADPGEDFMQKVKEITGRKGKKLFMPVRIALSGNTKGPELKKLFGC